MAINLVPLAVDLDGTLVKTDLLYESFFALIKQNPFNLFRVIFWLFTTNRATMKHRIAERVGVNVQLLPYNDEVVKWVKEQREAGRKTILATASHQKYAQAIAEHLGIFDEVMATHSGENLKGATKAARLVEQFGDKGFDYVGDSSADLRVWESANQAIVVARSAGLEDRARETATVAKVFAAPLKKASLWRAMRPHQWVKNTLIFVPLLTSHNFANLTLLILSVLAFIAFSLCASSVYILNDCLDLEDDRRHVTKRLRPFASGGASILSGVMVLVVSLIVVVILAASIGTQFLLVLAIYFSLTLAYSFFLKHQLIVDIVLLASLYTMRIIAGAAAIAVPLSFWLLAFSVFIFLSLAIVKRYTELHRLTQQADKTINTARGYHTDDLPLLAALGSASGYISVLIMALYVNSAEVRVLYDQPQMLWLVLPLLLFWISRVWLIAHRGQMHDDPILFVIKDNHSRITALLVLLVFFMAS